MTLNKESFINCQFTKLLQWNIQGDCIKTENACLRLSSSLKFFVPLQFLHWLFNTLDLLAVPGTQFHIFSHPLPKHIFPSHITGRKLCQNCGWMAMANSLYSHIIFKIALPQMGLHRAGEVLLGKNPRTKLLFPVCPVFQEYFMPLVTGLD